MPRAGPSARPINGFDNYALTENIEQGALFGTATKLTSAAGGAVLFANSTLGSTLNGLGGNDILFDGAGNDTLIGQGGSDTLTSNAGADLLMGGAGDDLYAISNPNAALVEAVGAGTDIAIFQTNGSWVLAPNIEFGLLVGPARILTAMGTGQVLANFGAGGATIAGGSGSDTIWGKAGVTDTLFGQGGDDVLAGQGGTDTIFGGMGDDTFLVTSAGEGTDFAWVSVDGWTVPEFVERAGLNESARVLSAGAGAQVLFANPNFASTLSGGAGDDILYGTAQAEVMTGGSGNDWYVSSGGADRIVINAPNWGDDVVFGAHAGMILDMRGSGIAGLGSFTAIHDFAATETTPATSIFQSALGSLVLSGMSKAQAEAAMIF
ncbi:calcium-binding protein [Sabulicella rubraurantiaca]|uniref:calcium-binding protein n=1 Tax=Sabulicella rubraurantiaca TaxID=2811429 RepID=UPI001A972B3C|nr:calcium-binding protein [Sabulicella rubraurantiaca]